MEAELRCQAIQLAKLERLYIALGRGYLDYRLKLEILKERAGEGTLDLVPEQSVHVPTQPLDRREHE